MSAECTAAHILCLLDRPTCKEDERLLEDLDELLSCLGIWCTYKAALDYKKNIGKLFSLDILEVL